MLSFVAILHWLPVSGADVEVAAEVAEKLYWLQM